MRRYGLLALDDDIPRTPESLNDVFELGMILAIDNWEVSEIKTILDNLIEREHDPGRLKLLKCKKDAVLSIRSRDNTRVLAMKMMYHFDNYVRKLVEESFLKD
jgi:flagellar motor component MotA